MCSLVVIDRLIGGVWNDACLFCEKKGVMVMVMVMMFVGERCDGEYLQETHLCVCGKKIRAVKKMNDER